MRILFLGNFPINFGASSVATVLRQGGHDVHLINHPLSKWKDPIMYENPENFFCFDTISEEALNWKPDIIAFSIFSANFMFYKRATDAIRSKSDVPILVGGVLPTIKPDLFMDNSFCDFVFRGEAEAIILELVEKIQTGTFHDVPNLVYRGEDGKSVHNARITLEESLDSLPFYDKEFYPHNSKALFMITSRGCVLDCTFCAAGKYSRENVNKGDEIVRKRSVDSVIAEIKQAQEERTYKEIFFYDDFFITTSKWLTEFTEKYTKEINLPYTCIAFPATITPKIAELLAKSKCRMVLMGFQTANNEYKRNVLKRKETKEQVQKAKNTLDEYGVDFSLDHIFNFPGETPEHIKESLDFYIDNKVKNLSIFFLNYYPDNALTTYANDNGFFTPDQYAKILKNEMIGEQSYKGTITDVEKSKLTVQYAVHFRLMSFLPGNWVKWLFDKKVYRIFPTNRFVYYFISIISELAGRGLNKGLTFLFHVLFLSFSNKQYSTFKDLQGNEKTSKLDLKQPASS